jgi:taurine dioxygenase
MKIEKLNGALGARITDIDLTQPIDDAAFRQIHQAWLDHLMLVFPGQTLGEEDQLHFTALFGELGGRNRHVATAEGDRVSHPGIMLISNIREDGKPIGSLPDGEMMFHSDGAYAKRPFRYTLLYALEIPKVGGNTIFANLYKAYDALPAALKNQLANFHAEHVYYAGTVQKDQPTDSLTGTRTHPLVITHEETGRIALFASRLFTIRIPELSEAESDEVLEELFDHMEKPEFLYEHIWTPGDFLMWDNRCTNHARTDFSGGERRLLRRTTVLGIDPVAARLYAA